MCPTPDKHRYPSRHAAQRGRVNLYEARVSGTGRLVVYPCGDHWHVGHQRPGRRRGRR